MTEEEMREKIECLEYEISENIRDYDGYIVALTMERDSWKEQYEKLLKVLSSEITWKRIEFILTYDEAKRVLNSSDLENIGDK